VLLLKWANAPSRRFVALWSLLGLTLTAMGVGALGSPLHLSDEMGLAADTTGHVIYLAFLTVLAATAQATVPAPRT